MEYLHGDRVRILGKPEWGPGFVLGKCKNGKVRVDFERAGEKTLSLQHAKMMKVVLRDSLWLEERAREYWQNH